MKYHVRFSNRVFVVDVEGTRVTVDGEALEAHFARIPGTPLRHLLLGPDGSSWTVAAQRLEGPGRWALGLAGERLEVEVVDDRTRQIQELTGRSKPTGRGGTVVAPMPGLVVRIEVTEGQEVPAGAGLAVVEAMKMENELKAPRAGRVGKIHVAVGAAVEKGAPLVTLEEPGT